MPEFNPEPMQVNASPTPAQISAGFRQFVLAVGPLLGYLGWAGAESALNSTLQYVGPASAAIAFLWGQWDTRHRAKQAATMASNVSDSVAQLK